jgi:hypothetical protein
MPPGGPDTLAEKILGASKRRIDALEGAPFTARRRRIAVHLNRAKTSVDHTGDAAARCVLAAKLPENRRPPSFVAP